ncbi:hypothetical protein VB151_08300 [Xanthomonas fragariae]|uniref:Uncharacterized protein n=1 Tax=Xanthomonas fragariae TaxID=48664 RepID=A0A1Y6H6G8_9XANT|nr:hypothetical protein [Xanthomonas fragariae]AOD14705.1 hypothetical protein BER92_08125 [Xanthomonas fragariae]AOD18100.1 hypothetical protein BER93_08155 [Xanthomonas fragariae]ENZ96308.1 hypothetical protein O1K_04686 [Xanthomonas fragariae LMG 25863]MBL9195889.1 hypothetical protein [Xanthomonas fragariae]MBL9220602.1 hypothetical protein [Xanthomonas fragariae]
MNSPRFTRPVLLLFGNTLFAIGCLGAASSQVTKSGADYDVPQAVTENETTFSGARTWAGLHLRALLWMPDFSFAQVLRPRS